MGRIGRRRRIRRKERRIGRIVRRNDIGVENGRINGEHQNNRNHHQ